MLSEYERWMWQVFKHWFLCGDFQNHSKNLTSSVQLSGIISFANLQVFLSCLFTILDSDYLEQITLKQTNKQTVTITKWSAWKTDQREAKGQGRLQRVGQHWKEVIVNSVHTADEQGELQKYASWFELFSRPNSRNSVGPFVDAEFLPVSKAAVPLLPMSLPVWCTAWRKTA